MTLLDSANSKLRIISPGAEAITGLLPEDLVLLSERNPKLFDVLVLADRATAATDQALPHVIGEFALGNQHLIQV